jgi:hypothetical protein
MEKEITAHLMGKTVRYHVASGKSMVVNGPVRIFKIEGIEKVGENKKGDTYVVAKVKDIDQGGEDTYRTLIFDNIEFAV